MKTIFTLLFVIGIGMCSAVAQYSTPGTGVRYDIDSLVSYGAVSTFSGDAFFFNQDFTLSAGDSLFISGDIELFVDDDFVLSIAGYLDMGNASEAINFTMSMNDDSETGIRIESTGQAVIRNIDFLGGGGIKVISPDFVMSNCSLVEMHHTVSNNAALEFFTGSPIISNCLFTSNLGAAISSPANVACSPQISNCTFVSNNTENTNRPSINLGPSGADETLITDCSLSGDPNHILSGGIAISSLLGVENHATIQNCEIVNNRYGIAIVGGQHDVHILNNTISFNVVQNEPLQGGSGINLNGTSSSTALIEGNAIRNNLWGITVQGEFGVDLGTPGVPEGSQGNNTFSENGNEGQTYALFNNTPNPLFAENNCWIEGQESTPEQVEDVISHSVDDASLGAVEFAPYLCGIASGVDDTALHSFEVYPNPGQEVLLMQLPEYLNLKRYEITSMTGHRIALPQENLSDHRLDISALASGVYTLKVLSESRIYSCSFIKE